MATVIIPYSQMGKILAGDGDWTDGTLKLAAVTSSYTPSAAHTVWADVSGNEASGTNYSAGGETLANASKTNTKLDADDVTFSNVTITFRYLVCYFSGTLESLTNPLLFYILVDDTPDDIVVTAADYPVVWNSNGIIAITNTAG